MKLIILGVALFISATALAQKPSCEVKANHWYNSANLQITSFKPISFQECFERGQDLFDSTVEDGIQIINPLKNTVTVKSWTTQYKKVKITHRDEAGMKTTETLERDEVVKGPVAVKIMKVKSGFRCWTKGECEPVENN